MNVRSIQLVESRRLCRHAAAALRQATAALGHAAAVRALPVAALWALWALGLVGAAGVMAEARAAGEKGVAQSVAPSRPSTGTVSPLFREADLPLGQKLIAEHQCATCHARRVGGDGSGIYRPLGKISTPGLLRGMVDYCSTELNLGLFPEEVTAVAAVLDRDHYRFGARR